MCSPKDRTSRGLSLLTLIASGVVVASNLHAATGDWEHGDVFVNVGGGTYKVFSNAGGYKESFQIHQQFIDSSADGPAFGADGRDLYALVAGEELSEILVDLVVVLDTDHPHPITQTIDGAAHGGELLNSIVFDASGNFYVSCTSGNADLQKFNAAGVYLESFDVSVGKMALAPDQRTLFMNGGAQRYDLATHTALPDLPGGGGSGFRMLPPFDGSGGRIVARALEIRRIDAAGTVIQTYDAPLQSNWFYVALDPDGTTFWAPGGNAKNLYRFDIDTGALVLGPIPFGVGGVGGLVVRGEILGGTTPSRFDAPTPCETPVMATAGVLVSFTVQASDINAGDVVSLTASGLPSGATLSPDLPSNGNPVSVTLDWIPSGAQVGTHLITFTATDFVGHETTCTATVVVEGPGDAYCFGDGLDPVVTAVCPCTNFGDPGRGCANSNGLLGGGRLCASGTTSPNTILLTCDGVPNGALATFMRGPNHDVQGAVFGDGIKCLTSPLFRFGSQNAGTIGNPPSTVEVGAPNEVPGSTVHYFVQYRNSVPGFCAPQTFNASNGYTIVWQ